MYGRISDPGMGLYPSRVALVPRTQGWGFHTVRVSIRGTTDFVPVCWCCKCMEGFVIRVCHLFFPGCDWLYELRFHTVQGVMDPGYHHFRPRLVGVVDILKHF